MTPIRILLALLLAGFAVPLSAQEGEDVTTLAGRLEPTKVVAVGAQVSGPVARVLVEEGDTVAEGELLARIDPEPFRARLDEARARAAEARAVAEDADRQLERQEKIYNRGLSSARDLEIAQRNAKRDRAALEAAEAAARSAQVDLERTQIRSPLDGVVLQRNVEPGETVIANLQPPLLFRVAASLERLDLVVEVPAGELHRLAEGDRIRVEVPALDQPRFTGRVARVAGLPEGEGDKARYAVRIRVPNGQGRLRPGMAARALLQ
jgi:HlyD family secretion protein